MPNAFVLNKFLDDDAASAVNRLLTRIGFTCYFGSPAEESPLDIVADIAVVCLPLASEEQPQIDEQAKRLAGIGLRIVCIWLKDEGHLPSGLEKFGAASVRLDSPQAEEILKGEIVWEDASGNNRAKQNIPRNKC